MDADEGSEDQDASESTNRLSASFSFPSPFRSTNANPFSTANANFSKSANANTFSTANVNPSKSAKINPFSTANTNLQTPGVGFYAGARPPWATTSKGCDSSGNSASSANPFASANAGKKNPFATEAAGGSVVRSSQFNMFVVDNPVLRRLKRLKSLELPMADARQLVAALVAPRTNSRQFGVHRDADLALCPFGVCAVQGPRVHMEDRYCVVGSLLQDPYASFFGVFDGHGGSNVADFCAANLFKNVADQLKTRGLQEAAGCLEDAFLQTDDQVRNTPQQLAGRDPLVGSTAVAMIITSTDCYIANVGDSRAVLVSHGRSEPTELTEDHKPNNPEERRRILEAGGRLSEDNRVEGILSMSRAIGDRALKKYVISRPQVIHRKLVSEDKAVILGTDGLWDFINCVNASNIVKLAESPQQAADKLVAAAMNGRSNDNTTALVVDLDAMRDASDLRVQQARRHAEATAAKASAAAAAAAAEEEEEEVVLALPSQRAKKGQQRGRKKLTIDV
ncbi:Protein phosphatase family protein [Hondaea fermentalgiana]|uniref:Protein phosphatase family protein n=1 Tax=Hondaea fermentalgiana TaxID=2315210 RepID=A0A2R5GPA5_9STRA|nr:Protein phosphatase family protein [Hondaea fermentalgiana]|eukprot:GBG30453.1 Protein phosphatase family protein [Hondaea fermentalgiana]